MTGQIRARSKKIESRNAGNRPGTAANRSPRRVARSLAIVLAFASLTAGPAQAAEKLVDFEEFTGPRRLSAADPPLTVGEATFSGGQIVTDVTRLSNVNRTTVYGTSHICKANGCQRAMTIEFSEPVSDVSFLLMNGRTAAPWFEIEYDAGRKAFFWLGAFYTGQSKRVITLPASGIRKITIGESDNVTSFWWRFYIDNLRYTVDGDQQYLVNFSAFVPHDNVPAGPTASCLSKPSLSDGKWQPPGLARLGRLPSGKARWARDNSFSPANGRPSRFGGGANSNANSDDGLEGNNRKLFFAGDNRDFHSAAPTYRLRQLVTVITDANVDANGIKDGSVRNLAREAKAFAEDAMADGIIDTADEDGISDDCRLFHRAHLAETDLMDVTVTRTGLKSLEIHFSGTLDSPMVGPAQVLGAIDWDFTLTLDDTVEPGAWTLSGAHDGFPAYEIYINGEQIYRHDPGPPPYDFAKNVRKLLPPLDVEVTRISGELP